MVVGHRLEGQVVQHRAVSGNRSRSSNLVGAEPKRVMLESLDQARRCSAQLHRVAEPSRAISDSSAIGLDPLRAQVAQAERAQPLGQRLALRAGQQGMMREGGTVPPSASMIWIWVAVLVTWSEPRTTWVTPISVSSTTEASV